MSFMTVIVVTCQSGVQRNRERWKRTLSLGYSGLLGIAVPLVSPGAALQAEVWRWCQYVSPALRQYGVGRLGPDIIGRVGPNDPKGRSAH